MDENEFLAARLAFARRLVRLRVSPTRSGMFLVEPELAAVEGAVTDSENVNRVLVTTLPTNDARIRSYMEGVGHVLADLPSAVLFGSKVPNPVQRQRRYELVAALASSSGLPSCLLDGDKYADDQFAAQSDYFQSRDMLSLNEQYITIWCRRLLAPYQLNIMDAFSPKGRTTEQLLQQHLGSGEDALAWLED